ncbi:unnamed protein product [Periconia digitata]|uniref:WSC domain-containing protein n=1 Tax=Periconia digitata TaxID=1303443 RepID=A0A9W4UI75_9PLEO|nr:unnamed protein product [Periconia digitata]
MSLGCYTEGTNGRSLEYSQWDFLNVSSMTTETCLTTCGKKGFPFAGTEFGRECYCGVVLGNGTLPTDAGQCSTPCTGNSTETCGGPDRLSLYVAKNLESTDPCAPPIISSTTPTPTPTPTSSTPTSSPSTPSTSTPKSSTTTPCAGHYCPITTKPSSSTSKTSTSTPKSSTTKCTGYCAIPPPVKPSSTSTAKATKPTSKPTSTLKPSTTKCSGYQCATSTTLRTTTAPTLKPTIPPCQGILCWPPPGNPSTSCWLGLICPPATTKTTSKSSSSVKTTSQKSSSTKKSSSTVQGYPTVPRPTHY